MRHSAQLQGAGASAEAYKGRLGRGPAGWMLGRRRRIVEVCRQGMAGRLWQAGYKWLSCGWQAGAHT